MVGGQIMIIFVGGKAFHVTPLNGPQWGYSIVLGALSLPMAIIIRVIPDEWVTKLVPMKWKRGFAPEVVEKEEKRRKEMKRRSRPEDLSFIKAVRGGRVRSMKFKLEAVRAGAGYDDKMMGFVSGVGYY